MINQDSLFSLQIFNKPCAVFSSADADTLYTSDIPYLPLPGRYKNSQGGIHRSDGPQGIVPYDKFYAFQKNAYCKQTPDHLAISLSIIKSIISYLHVIIYNDVNR